LNELMMCAVVLRCRIEMLISEPHRPTRYQCIFYSMNFKSNAKETL